MIQNTLIATGLFIGTLIILYGNTPLIEQTAYKVDVLKEKLRSGGLIN